MTLIIAGTVRVPPEHVEALRPHMLEMREATRAEVGCQIYGYAEDVGEPGLIHVFEVWDDQASLDAHIASPHMATWRAAGARYGVHGRALTAYEVASSRPL